MVLLHGAYPGTSGSENTDNYRPLSKLISVIGSPITKISFDDLAYQLPVKFVRRALVPSWILE
jgi:hypothetical protein